MSVSIGDQAQRFDLRLGQISRGRSGLVQGTGDNCDRIDLVIRELTVTSRTSDYGS